MNIINKEDGNDDIIDFAVDYLVRGKVIAYPTETVYGLGCDATNLRAVKRINKMKGSDESKQLLILVDSMKMAKEYAVLNKAALDLARRYWPNSASNSAKASLDKKASQGLPGPLTLILPTTPFGKKLLKNSTVALRYSSSEIATALVKKLKRPIVSTSANLSTDKPARTGLEVANKFITTEDEPDIILDAGKLPASKGSTIVDCTGDKVIVVRRGDLKLNK